MSEIAVNIDDYITEQEKRDIVKSAFHAVCVQKSKEDFERILSNAAYALVHKLVDDALDGEMVEIIKEKSLSIINDLSAFSVFRPKDHWHSGESVAWTILQSSMREHKQLISDRVANLIEDLGHEQVRELLENHLLDELVSRITRE